MNGVKALTVARGDGETYTTKVTPVRTSWHRLALGNARELEDAGILPGGHGVGALAQDVTALMSDGSILDVTARFVAEGWAAWLEADWNTTVEEVPRRHVARLRRVRATWAMPERAGADPAAEAEFEAARLAELAAMNEEAAASLSAKAGNSALQARECGHGRIHDLFQGGIDPEGCGTTAT